MRARVGTPTRRWDFPEIAGFIYRARPLPGHLESFIIVCNAPRLLFNVRELSLLGVSRIRTSARGVIEGKSHLRRERLRKPRDRPASLSLSLPANLIVLQTRASCFSSTASIRVSNCSDVNAQMVTRRSFKNFFRSNQRRKSIEIAFSLRSFRIKRS